MVRAEDSYVKRQELGFLEGLKDEGMVMGTMKWAAGLRGGKRIVKPIGYKVEGNNIFMHLQSGRANEVRSRPDFEEMKSKYSNFRQTK
jgi:hypothetical protein